MVHLLVTDMSQQEFVFPKKQYNEGTFVARQVIFIPIREERELTPLHQPSPFSSSSQLNSAVQNELKPLYSAFH